MLEMQLFARWRETKKAASCKRDNLYEIYEH